MKLVRRIVTAILNGVIALTTLLAKARLVLTRYRKPLLVLLLLATWGTVLGGLAYYVFPAFSRAPVDRQSLIRLQLDGVNYTLTAGHLDLDAQDIDVEYVATARLPWQDLVTPRPKGQRQLLTGPHVFKTMESRLDVGFFFFDDSREFTRVPPESVGTKIGSKWEEGGHPRVKVFGDPKLYPFDEYYLAGWLSMPAYVKWEDGTVYQLNTDEWESVVFENKDPRFVLKPVGSDELLDEILNTNGIDLVRNDASRIPWNRRNYFTFKLTRPVFLKVLAVVFLITAILWLLYIGASKQEGAQIANVLGYLAALWAVRDILSGKSEVFPTVVDYSVLFLYVATILVVFTRAALRWARRTT